MNNHLTKAALYIMQCWTNEGGELVTGEDWYSVAERVPGFCEALSNQLVDIDLCAFYLRNGRCIELNEETQQWEHRGDWGDVVPNLTVTARLELLDVLVAQGEHVLAEHLVGMPRA